MTERQYNHTIWKQTWTPREGVEVTVRVETKKPLGSQEMMQFATVIERVEGWIVALEEGEPEPPQLALDDEQPLDYTRR